MVKIISFSIVAIIVFAMAKTSTTKFLLVDVGGESEVLHKRSSKYNIIIGNSSQCELKLLFFTTFSLVIIAFLS